MLNFYSLHCSQKLKILFSLKNIYFKIKFIIQVVLVKSLLCWLKKCHKRQLTYVKLVNLKLKF